MTHRRFISLILAAALAVTGMTSGPAQAGDRDVAKWVAGAVALGLVGAVIADQRRDDRAVTRYRNSDGPRFDSGYRRGHGRYHQPGRRHGHQSHRGHHRDRYALPGHCRQDVRVRGGILRGYGRHCLLNNYSRFNALPHHCAVETRGYGRGGIVYDTHCLNRYGYRDDGRHK
ncbi:MAG: hypothetical protein ACE369_07370 [Roseovarius sp.]